MSSLHVRFKVCMAPFHVQSKVCITPFQVRSNFAVFAPHIEGSMQTLLCTWQEAMQTLLRTWSGNTVSGTKIAKIAILANVLKVYMIYLTTFENKNILRESTFKTRQKLSLLSRSLSTKQLLANSREAEWDQLWYWRRAH